MPAGPVPDAFHDILESKAFAVATTLGSTGEPHVNPIWFLWNGEHILLSLWGNKQKFRNLQRDARIAIAFADPANPYRYLEVRGRVERLDSDANGAVSDAISIKYTGHAADADEEGAALYVATVEVERYTFHDWQNQETDPR